MKNTSIQNNPYNPVQHVTPDPAVGNVIVSQHGSELWIRFKPAYVILGIFILGTLMFGFMTVMAYLKMQSLSYTLIYAGLTVAEALAFIYYAYKYIKVKLNAEHLIVEERRLNVKERKFDLASLTLSIKSHRVRGFEFYSLQLLDKDTSRAYGLQGPRRFTGREVEYLKTVIENFQKSPSR